MHEPPLSPNADTFSRLLGKSRLKHLQLVVHIAELESVQKAASRIGLSQPAATQALAEFEQLLGADLFERHAKGMRLSPVGLTLIPMIRAALNQVQAFAETAVSMRTGSQAVIRVGAIGAGVCGLLAQALPGFSLAHPGIAVEVHDVKAQELLQSLEHEFIDLLVCREIDALPAGMVFHPVLQDRYVVAGCPSHPIFAKREVSMDDLEAATWITPPVRSIAASEFNKLCSGFQQSPKLCRISSYSLFVTLALLESRDLLALMPYRLASQLLSAGKIAILDIKNAELAPLGVMAKSEPGALTSVLLDYLVGHTYSEQSSVSRLG